MPYPSTFGHHHEQSAAVHAAHHASKTPTIEVNRLQHVTLFANTHAALVGNIGVPDGVIRIDADAIRNAVTEVGPYAPIRQVSVHTYIKGRQPLALGLSDDQCRVVGRYCHSVREGHAIGYLSNGPEDLAVFRFEGRNQLLRLW